MSRNLFTILSAALLLSGLAGCSEPTRSAHALDQKAQLAVVNAPETAEILVDGVSAGQARAYDGLSSTLALPGGTHRVEIRVGSQLLYSQSVFMGEGAIKTITLP